MRVNERLIKKTRFVIDNWMFPELYEGDEELAAFAKRMGHYMRNLGYADYPTEKDFDETLRKYLNDHDMEVDDEPKFIREVKKGIGIELWWK